MPVHLDGEEREKKKKAEDMGGIVRFI